MINKLCAIKMCKSCARRFLAFEDNKKLLIKITECNIVSALMCSENRGKTVKN